MRLIALSSLTCLALACDPGATVNSHPSADAGTVDQTDGAPTSNAQISGDITSNQAWSGEIELSADATIKAGVVVTMAAGTTFTGAQGALLRVEGELSVNGTAAEPVTMNPVDGAGGWGGFVAESGGKVALHNITGTKVATLLNCASGALECILDGVHFTGFGKVIDASAPATLMASDVSDMANAGIAIKPGADVHIVDSKIWTSTHDIVVQTGGDLLIEYSEIGGANLSYEHCDIHIGAADSFTIRYSNMVDAVYGMMLGNTTNAVIQYNNFIGNDPGHDLSPIGPNTAADVRYNYWDQGAPSLGADYDTSSPASAKITEAGPRI